MEVEVRSFTPLSGTKQGALKRSFSFPAKAARASPRSFPGKHLESRDPFEFAGVGGDKGGSETAGLGSDQKIQRPNRRAGRLQSGPDVGIVQRRIEGEFGDPKEIQECFESGALLGMRLQVLLHASPEFSRHDDRDAGERGVGQFAETGPVAQHRDAGAGIEQERRFQGRAGSELGGGTLMCRRPGRRLRKVATLRKRFSEMAGDLGEGTELRRRHGREDDLCPLSGNPNLGAFEAEGLGQADCLAASVLKDFRRRHSYFL